MDFRTTYKRAVKLPMVVMARGRVVKRDGRKLHVVGCLEDKDGEFALALASWLTGWLTDWRIGNIMAQAEGIWVMMGSNVGRSQL